MKGHNNGDLACKNCYELKSRPEGKGNRNISTSLPRYTAPPFANIINPFPPKQFGLLVLVPRCLEESCSELDIV